MLGTKSGHSGALSESVASFTKVDIGEGQRGVAGVELRLSLSSRVGNDVHGLVLRPPGEASWRKITIRLSASLKKVSGRHSRLHCLGLGSEPDEQESVSPAVVTVCNFGTGRCVWFVRDGGGIRG